MSDAMSDLINLASEQKPIDFQNAFNDIMSTKIASAVSAVKDQLSKDVFSGLVSSDDQEEVEEE
jgi:hypothetical protein